MGFEPMHEGFADLSLTTWVRYHYLKTNITPLLSFCKALCAKNCNLLRCSLDS